MITLRELKPGETGRIEEVGGEGALRQHFLDMGLIPGIDVTVVKLAPMGDPMELMIRGYELTLRLDDAAQIRVSPAGKNAGANGKPEGKGTCDSRVFLLTLPHKLATIWLISNRFFGSARVNVGVIPEISIY